MEHSKQEIEEYTKQSDDMDEVWIGIITEDREPTFTASDDNHTVFLNKDEAISFEINLRMEYALTDLIDHVSNRGAITNTYVLARQLVEYKAHLIKILNPESYVIDHRETNNVLEEDVTEADQTH